MTPEKLHLAVFKPGLARPAAWGVLALCLASVAAATWIADSGGPIRRPDFRDPGTLTEPTKERHES